MGRKWLLSQDDLAQRLGVFRVSDSNWKTGTRAIPSFLPSALEAVKNRMMKGGKNGHNQEAN